YLVEGLAATVGATLGTLPVSAWWFQSIPPLGAIANLIALPTLGLVLVPIAAVACTAPEPLSHGAAVVGTALPTAVLAVLAPLAIDPWTPAVGPLGATGLAIAVTVGARRAWLGIGLGAAVLLWPRWDPDPLRVTFLDVGQGSAALVEDHGRRVLVDG